MDYPDRRHDRHVRYIVVLGIRNYQMAPPIPATVKSASGKVIYTRNDIETGQNVWQSIGGMEQGSIWGHGSYLAPDWSADWLHREAETLLAIKTSRTLPGLTPAQIEAVQKASLVTEMRRNIYTPENGTITLSDDRAQAIRQVETHYLELYQGAVLRCVCEPNQRRCTSGPFWRIYIVRFVR